VGFFWHVSFDRNTAGHSLLIVFAQSGWQYFPIYWELLRFLLHHITPPTPKNATTTITQGDAATSWHVAPIGDEVYEPPRALGFYTYDLLSTSFGSINTSI
jgi:hypothetical protein